MGALLSYFGRPYAAIGGSVCGFFGDDSGHAHTRPQLVALLRSALDDGTAAIEKRAEALVLLYALETCLSSVDLFIFVDDLVCPYTETRLRSTLLEAVIRKHPKRAVVCVGPELIDVHIPGASRNPTQLGADAYWLTLNEKGADEAGALLQRSLSEHALPDPFIFSLGLAPPVPGVESLTAIDRARLFDAVARDNLALSDSAPMDCCTVTYIQDAGFTRWLANDTFGSRNHGVATATALLSRKSTEEAEREFASL
jgi:hypothetical protein